MSREKILSRLRSEAARRTPSEQQLARFFETHLDELPFETAASIAEKLNLSAVTVGRFLRRLGYSKITELTQALRADLRSPAWQTKANDTIEQDGAKAQQLNALVTNLTRLFERTADPEWARTVYLIARSQRVFVASFQNLRGIGRYFADQLAYARPGVRFAGGEDGVFSAIFEGSPAETCLIIIDSRRYARKAGLLARRAMAAGIHVVGITDIYCQWQASAEIIVTDPGEGEVFWDSAVSTVALLELVIQSVTELLGDQAQKQISEIADLQDYFGDFSDS